MGAVPWGPEVLLLYNDAYSPSLSRIDQATRLIDAICASDPGRGTRYELGAMQAVGERYKQVLLQTAGRVGIQLESAVGATMHVDFRLKGSVPLDVGIRAVSDVDLLTLDGQKLTYSPFGALARAGNYHPTTLTSLQALAELHREAQSLLRSATRRRWSTALAAGA